MKRQGTLTKTTPSYRPPIQPRPSGSATPSLNTLNSLKAHLQSQFDEKSFDCFIQPTGVVTVAGDPAGEGPLFTLLNKSLNSDHRSLLVLGDSGFGKTTVSLCFCLDQWERYEKSPDSERLPLYIHLPQIEASRLTTRLLEDYLENQIGMDASDRLWLKKQKLLLILDGYDEIKVHSNFYVDNHWEHLDIKTITCCRPEALQNKPGFSQLFEVLPTKSTVKNISNALKKSFLTINLQPFSLHQIHQYVQAIIHHPSEIMKNASWWTSEWQSEATYIHWLENLSSLRELIECPFLLSLITQILPKIVSNMKKLKEPLQYHYTRTNVYDQFLESWLEYQADRIRKNHGFHELKGDLIDYLEAYANNLSSQLLVSGQINERLLTEQECLVPTLAEPVKNAAVLALYIEHDKAFFAGLDAPQNCQKLSKERMTAIRSGCLLRTQDGKFRFLHKSIAEYFAAKSLFIGIQGEFDHYVQHVAQRDWKTGLNRQTLRNEPQIMARLAERGKQDPLFYELLWRVVYASREMSGLQIAAANALSILVIINPDISGKDLSYIQVPGANLNNVIAEGTLFKHANLNDAWLENAWLRNSQFQGAYLSNVTLEKNLPIILPSYISKIIYYGANGADDARTHYWLTLTKAGSVDAYDVLSGAHIRTIIKKPSITNMAVCESLDMLIVGEIGVSMITLYSLGSGEQCDHFPLRLDDATDVFESGTKIYLINKNIIIKDKLDVSIIETKTQQNFKISTATLDICADEYLFLPNKKALFVFKPEPRLANLNENLQICDDTLLNISAMPKLKNIRFSSVSYDESVIVCNNAWQAHILVLERLSHKYSVKKSSNDPVTTIRRENIVGKVIFSKDSRHVIVLDEQFTIYIYNLSGVLTGEIASKLTGSINCDVAINSAGSILAVATQNHFTLQCLSTVFPNKNLIQRGKKITAIDISADNQFVVIAGGDGDIRIYRNKDGVLYRHFSGKPYAAKSIFFSRDSQHLIFTTINDYSKILSFLMNIPADKMLKTYAAGAYGGSGLTALYSDKTIIAIPAAGYAIKLYDFHQKKELATLVTTHRDDILALDISAGNKYLASFSKDRVLCAFDLITYQLQHHSKLDIGSFSEVSGVASQLKFLDGEQQLVLIIGGNAWVFFLKRKFMQKIFSGHTAAITGIDYSPLANILVTVSTDKKLIFWDAHNYYPIATVAYPYPIHSIKLNKALTEYVIGTEQGVYTCVYARTDKTVKVMHKWADARPDLNLENANISQAFSLGLSLAKVFHDHGACGEPAPQGSCYLPQCELYRPVPGTADHRMQTSLIPVLGLQLSISDSVWVLTVARQMKPKLSHLPSPVGLSIRGRQNHLFLVIEGIMNFRRFIIRAELTTVGNQETIVQLRPFTDLDTFHESAKTYEAQQWQISRKKGLQLLDNIREDQVTKIKYSMLGGSPLLTKLTQEEHLNCITWVKKQLTAIGISVDEKWYNFLVTHPKDMTQVARSLY